MGDGSSEELSKELSNLSFTSNASSDISATTGSRISHHDSTSTHDYLEESDVSRGSTEVSVSRGSTEVSSVKGDEYDYGVQKETTALQASSHEDSLAKKDVSPENSSAYEDEQKARNDDSSFSNREQISRESSTVTERESLSRESTLAYSSQISRETTKISEREYSSEESNVLSRESTMRTNSEIYQSDFETSRENTMLTANESPEQLFINHDNADIDDEMDKEKSVLIERDGKFELLDKSELEASELEMLGLSNKKPSTKSTKSPVLNTHKRSSEYDHVTSKYGLTETQKEMKKRRISVRQMRMNEEKQRLLEEEERQKVANEKSYRKWLSQKSASSNRQAKKEHDDIAANEERRKLAQKSYNLWLKEKEQKKKEERKIEKIRLADEAEHYIVRDRAMCERSFRKWLRQKK